jgi:molybdenum cofactor cytidylyltransferase
VGFGAGCGVQLATLEGGLGASSILRSMRAIDSVADLAVDDVGVVTDIDTPEALAQAEALWLARVNA